MIQSTILKFLVIWPDPTHQPTHPPNYTPTLGWGSLHRFQIFKQNWNISISSSAIEFWLILGGEGGWMGVGVVRGCSHTCAQTCACTHTHAHAHTYDIIGNSHGFLQWGRPFAWNYHVYHACMCVCVHVCMCTCLGAPPNHPSPSYTDPPSPRATGSPKHQNSITSELIEIIRFCLKILYLWTFLNSYRL